MAVINRAYLMRAYAYAYLLTDGWPALED